MADLRVKKLAQLLVEYSLEIQPGERVGIRGSQSALPLVKECYLATLQAGGLPIMIWDEPYFEEMLLKHGNDDQLAYVSDPTAMMYTDYDCLISLRASENTRYLNGVDPDRQRLRQEGLRKVRRAYVERAARGDLRWTLTQFPTHAYAQDADMSLSEYEDFVYAACHVDKDDPVAEWTKLSKMQARLVDYLKGKEQVRVVGPNIELELSIKDRVFINSDGKRNMPSGEIFTGPVESSVNGWVRYTYPAIYRGREVDGIELKFEEGKVVSATAKKNEAYMLNVLDTDPGARYLGEFAIGTNMGIQQFTRSILYDEKIGGTIHMAVGSAYPETGSSNNSVVHWDMICDMQDGGQIYVDDELFYDSGKFKI